MKTDNKNIVRINESELKQMIAESVIKVINEMEMGEDEMVDEGLWNNLKTGVNTFVGKNQGKLSDRWNKAKANYKTQGELDNYSDLVQKLSDLLDQKKISPNTTVAQLVGGKYNNNKFGTMTGMVSNRKAQLRNRGYSGKF